MSWRGTVPARASRARADAPDAADSRAAPARARAAAARPGGASSVTWILGVALILFLAVVTLNTVRTDSVGLEGAAVGSTLPPFAAPLATSPLEGDASVAIKARDGAPARVRHRGRGRLQRLRGRAPRAARAGVRGRPLRALPAPGRPAQPDRAALPRRRLRGGRDPRRPRATAQGGARARLDDPGRPRPRRRRRQHLRGRRLPDDHLRRRRRRRARTPRSGRRRRPRSPATSPRSGERGRDRPRGRARVPAAAAVVGARPPPAACARRPASASA